MVGPDLVLIAVAALATALVTVVLVAPVLRWLPEPVASPGKPPQPA